MSWSQQYNQQHPPPLEDANYHSAASASYDTNMTIKQEQPANISSGASAASASSGSSSASSPQHQHYPPQQQYQPHQPPYQQNYQPHSQQQQPPFQFNPQQQQPPHSHYHPHPHPSPPPPTHQMVNGNPVVVASAVTFASHSEQPPSLCCHQCKTSKAESLFVLCTALVVKRNRRCAKKYCEPCLKRLYHVTAAQIQIETWICPSCEGRCSCAACLRNRKANPSGGIIIPQSINAQKYNGSSGGESSTESSPRGSKSSTRKKNATKREAATVPSLQLPQAPAHGQRVQSFESGTPTGSGSAVNSPVLAGRPRSSASDANSSGPNTPTHQSTQFSSVQQGYSPSSPSRSGANSPSASYMRHHPYPIPEATAAAPTAPAAVTSRRFKRLSSGLSNASANSGASSGGENSPTAGTSPVLHFSSMSLAQPDHSPLPPAAVPSSQQQAQSAPSSYRPGPSRRRHSTRAPQRADSVVAMASPPPVITTTNTAVANANGDMMNTGVELPPQQQMQHLQQLHAASFAHSQQQNQQQGNYQQPQGMFHPQQGMQQQQQSNNQQYHPDMQQQQQQQHPFHFSTQSVGSSSGSVSTASPPQSASHHHQMLQQHFQQQQHPPISELPVNSEMLRTQRSTCENLQTQLDQILLEQKILSHSQQAQRLGDTDLMAVMEEARSQREFYLLQQQQKHLQQQIAQNMELLRMQQAQHAKTRAMAQAQGRDLPPPAEEGKFNASTIAAAAAVASSLSSDPAPSGDSRMRQLHEMEAHLDFLKAKRLEAGGGMMPKTEPGGEFGGGGGGGFVSYQQQQQQQQQYQQQQNWQRMQQGQQQYQQQQHPPSSHMNMMNDYQMRQPLPPPQQSFLHPQPPISSRIGGDSPPLSALVNPSSMSMDDHITHPHNTAVTDQLLSRTTSSDPLVSGLISDDYFAQITNQSSQSLSHQHDPINDAHIASSQPQTRAFLSSSPAMNAQLLVGAGPSSLSGSSAFGLDAHMSDTFDSTAGSGKSSSSAVRDGSSPTTMLPPIDSVVGHGQSAPITPTASSSIPETFSQSLLSNDL